MPLVTSAPISGLPTFFQEVPLYTCILVSVVLKIVVPAATVRRSLWTVVRLLSLKPAWPVPEKERRLENTDKPSKAEDPFTSNPPDTRRSSKELTVPE